MNILILAGLAFLSLTQALQIKDCGSQSVKLYHYNLTPNEIQLPGDHDVSVKFEILKEIVSPVDLQVEIKRKVWFAWIPVPCIKNVGSCTYHDGCSKLLSLLAGKDCPKEITGMGLQCTCPMLPSVIELKNKRISLPDLGKVLGGLISGTYWARVQLVNTNTNEKHVCVEIDAQVK